MSAPRDNPEPDSNSGDDASPAGDGIPDDAYVFVLEQLLKGVKPRELRRSLADAGYTPKQVDEIIQTAQNYKKQNENQPTTSAGSAGLPILLGLALWAFGICIRSGGISSVEISCFLLVTDITGLVLIILGIVRAIRRRR